MAAALDVCVDRKGRNTEGLRHHDRGCLMANTREGLEGLEVFGDIARVGINEDFGEINDAASLARAKTTGSNDAEDMLIGHVLHIVGGVGDRKELGGDLVNALVSALCREEDGDQERVGIAVIERGGWIWVSIIKDLTDSLSFLLTFQV